MADALWRCLQNASHFPQLWLATDSQPPDDVPGELEGIARELYVWLHRYRRAIKLVEQCAGDWPEVAQVFYRRFWRGGIRRVADYLSRRMKEGQLPAIGDARATAHLVVESLAWMAVHREWSQDGLEVKDAVAEATVLGLLVPALCRRES